MSILPGGERTDATRSAVLKESIEVLRWIHANLDGLKVPVLPTSKRAQLAGGCWLVAIEHSQAIVVLVEHMLYGSALAMQRPLFEAYLRGMWLMHAATETDVDAAGRDEFPRDVNKLLDGVRRAGADHLVHIKEQWWSRMCSLTHTGYQQIGARLTAEGLGQAYNETEVSQALAWADGVGLLVVVALSTLAGDQPRAREAVALMQRLSNTVPFQ
jgi:hypothetical protein